MKTLRKFSLCMLMALLLLVVPTIFAQETFGLSDADFVLFTSASAISAEAGSLTYEFTVNFSVSGMGDDASATLSGSGVIGGDDMNPLFDLSVTGELVDSGSTTPVDLQLRLVGDTIYFNDGSGWQGSTVDDLSSQLGSMAGMMGGDLPVDPEDIASGDLSALAGMEGFSEAMMALASLNPNEFISMSRLNDVGGLAHFQVSLSISDLLSSPSLAPLFMMGMAGDMEGMEMSAEEMQMMMGMMGAMFATSSITFDQYIDPSTSLVERAVLDINIPIPDMSGTGSGTAVIALNFDIALSGYGDPVSVEAPADAVMMPSGG